jgi:hypothetical protein
MSVGTDGCLRDKYAKWQETNMKRSLPLAPPHVTVESDDQQSCGAQIARGRTGQEKDELLKLLMMLPAELHLHTFEFLATWDIVRLGFVSRGLYWLVRDLEDRIATAVINPQLAHFREYLKSFDYRGKLFIQALEHWNMTKGISLVDSRLNGSLFAKFWLAQNSDIDIEVIQQKPEECLNDLDELAKRLTNLHLIQHNPHKEHIDEKYPATSDNFTFWEQKVCTLTQFPDELNAEKLQAIERIKTDKKYLNGRIWAVEVSAEWDPAGTTNVHDKHYNTHIGAVTAYGRFEDSEDMDPEDIKTMDQDFRTFEKTLGLPPLIGEFGIDRCFAYCALEPDVYEFAKHINAHIHNERSTRGLTQIKYTSLAKAHIIENLTIY